MSTVSYTHSPSCRRHRSSSVRRPRPLAVGIAIALISAGFHISPALAQEANEAQETREDQPTQQTKGQKEKDSGTEASTLDQVTVTGTRIRREGGVEGPAPMTVLNADQIRASGLTEIADVVNQQPSLAVTQTDQTSNLAGNPGINALDLRGMGIQRTLVLVDGRRQVPSIPGTSAVDLSALPSSLIERVEIVTGGASALYGADAVTGVSNFILKKNFDGVDASVRYGNSSRGDMRRYSGDVLFGTNFADYRGNFTFYAFGEREPDTVSGQDRPWTAGGYPLYVPSNGRFGISDGNRNIYNSPDAQVILGGTHYALTGDGQLRTPALGPGGYLNAGRLRDQSPAGLLGGLLTDGGEYGGRYDSWYLIVPSDRKAARASLNFDFSDSAKFFANVGYADTDSQAAGRLLSAYGTDVVPADSPFITPEMIAAAGGSIDGGVNFARHFDEETGMGASHYRRKLLQAVIGLEGDFELLSRAWNYSAYYSNGRTREHVRDENVIAYDRWYLGLDSTSDTAGNPVCRSTLSDPGNGCVPINPFKRLTPEQVAYLQYTSDWSTSTMTQQVLSAYVGGGLFDLPGGELKLVVGGEYRKERNEIGAIPQYNPDSPLYDPSIGTLAVPLTGKYDVKEVFSEVHVPLLRDKPFAKRLALDMAARASDYSTSGRTVTNKFGLEWAPIDDIGFRGTYGKAVRAPNIGEMFTAMSVGGLWITDPCNTYNLANRTDRTQYTAANCAQLNPADTTTYWLWRDIISKGNLDLEPETAKTTTFGVVLRPRFLENLTVTADYYRIDLRGAIDTFPAQTIINKCVDAPTLDNIFCPLVTRDADGNLLEVVTQKLNLSKYVTRGVDIGLHYRHDLTQHWGGNAGTISFDMDYGRLFNRDYTLDPDQPDEVTSFAGVFGAPTWKGVTRTSWSNDKAGVAWTLRHFSKMRNGTQITDEQYEKVWAGSVFYSDFSGWFRLRSGLDLIGGVSNAFDRAPPRVPGAESGGANFELGYKAGVYDVIGRTYYAGLRLSL